MHTLKIHGLIDLTLAIFTCFSLEIALHTFTIVHSNPNLNLPWKKRQAKILALGPKNYVRNTIWACLPLSVCTYVKRERSQRRDTVHHGQIKSKLNGKSRENLETYKMNSGQS